MEARGRRLIAASGRRYCRRALCVSQPLPPPFIKLEIVRPRILPIDLARKLCFHMLAQFPDLGWIESAWPSRCIGQVVVGGHHIPAQCAKLAPVESGKKGIGKSMGCLG